MLLPLREWVYDAATDKRSGLWFRFFQFFLWVLSIGFGLGVAVRRLFYETGILTRHRLCKPVISIGNLTWGGVGKTPLVQCVIEVIQGINKRPAVLLRGYIPKDQRQRMMFSDEAVLLNRNLPNIPIVPARDRVRAAREFLAQTDVDVLVCDDAFQHDQLERNLDIVVLDAVNPFGNGHLIPRGILREPLKALARADLFVVTRADHGHCNLEKLKDRLHQSHPTTPIYETVHRPMTFINWPQGKERALSCIRGEKVVSFCSIGNPSSFQRTLEDMGAFVAHQFAFPDHYAYRKQDLESIGSYCRQQGVGTVVMTQKDAVKLSEIFVPTMGGIRCLVLVIKIEFLHGYEDFCQRITSLLCR
jgi:tetraacyldisaccharide 4'-kinase